MMKEREHYMFCSDCGYAFKEEEIFQKAYANTAICLCRECALKLAREIMDKYVDTHAHWKLTPHAFYRDTISKERELCVYVSAKCSNCGVKHPDDDEVYAVNLQAPEDEKYTHKWDVEEEKQKALEKAKTRRNFFYAPYCANCGAKMKGDKE